MASSAPTRQRLDPEVFRLPVERIREGYYSDAYFNFTRQLLVELGHRPVVTVQVFQKQHSVLGGIDEAIAVLKLCSEDWSALEVHALHEADAIEPWEPVLQIDGDYALFAHLETVYLGVLARRTRIMRNVREVVEAANGKPILFFPARHDHWLVQTGDGWAAHIAGAIGVSTDAQASWWGGRGGRHRAAQPDRCLRGRHRRRGTRLGGPLRGRDERHGARGLRERLGRNGPRGR